MLNKPKILLIPSCGIQPVDFPSRDTLIRLLQGQIHWQIGGFDLILLTGGIFNPRFVQTRPASHIMKDWLIGRGILEDFILTEDKSVDTYENIQFGLDVLGVNDLLPADITVLSQWQHARRFQISFFLGYGIYVHTIPLHYDISPRTALNEWLFMACHVLDPKGKGLLAARNREMRHQQALTV